MGEPVSKPLNPFRHGFRHARPFSAFVEVETAAGLTAFQIEVPLSSLFVDGLFWKKVRTR
jgi:hypothetical protein